jgi:hypothetical protein
MRRRNCTDIGHIHIPHQRLYTLIHLPTKPLRRSFRRFPPHIIKARNLHRQFLPPLCVPTTDGSCTNNAYSLHISLTPKLRRLKPLQQLPSRPAPAEDQPA